MTKKKKNPHDEFLFPMLLFDDIESGRDKGGGSLKSLFALGVIILSVLCCLSQLFAQ